MTGSLILDVAYLSVAILALGMTRAEARARAVAEPAQKSLAWDLLGVLACALWPVTVLVMAVTVTVTARRAAAAEAAEAARETALA